MSNMSRAMYFCAAYNKECLNSLKACKTAYCIMFRKMNAKRWVPAWLKTVCLTFSVTQGSTLVLGDPYFWEGLSRWSLCLDGVSAKVKEGWCSWKGFGVQGSSALGVLKRLSPLHFKPCQCFYVLMCSQKYSQPPGGTGLPCNCVYTEQCWFFFEQFGPFSSLGKMLLFLSSLMLWMP